MLDPPLFLVVVHTEPTEEMIRIISARSATRREVDLWHQCMDNYR